METPVGIEPTIAVLQTAPLATWVRSQNGTSGWTCTTVDNRQLVYSQSRLLLRHASIQRNGTLGRSRTHTSDVRSVLHSPLCYEGVKWHSPQDSNPQLGGRNPACSPIIPEERKNHPQLQLLHQYLGFSALMGVAPGVPYLP